jgi:hypothetical protein
MAAPFSETNIVATAKAKNIKVKVLTPGIEFPAGEFPEVGETLSMTEQQAKSRVGKVAPVGSAEASPSSAEAQQVAKQVDQIAKLTEEVKTLKAENAELTKALKAK